MGAVFVDTLGGGHGGDGLVVHGAVYAGIELVEDVVLVVAGCGGRWAGGGMFAVGLVGGRVVVCGIAGATNTSFG